MIKLVDIAWAAGIYEGEGHFGGHTVRIVQKDSWLPYELQRKFGGSVKQYTRSTDSKEYHYWTLSGPGAREFLLTIFTFLSPRRKAQILKHSLFFKDPNFLPSDFCAKGHKFTPENTFIEKGKNDKGEERTWRTCKICRKDHYDRKNTKRNDPQHQILLSISKMKGISIEEAKKFLIN
jgi:hypothetical protein